MKKISLFLRQLPSFPLFWLCVFVLFFCGGWGFLWIQKGLTNQELLANASKAFDFLQGAGSVKGWPWWTPFFNFGHSLADSFGTIFTYLLILAGNLAMPFDLVTGPKVMVLIFMAASGFAMFGFVKKLSQNPWSALAAAIFYVACPQIALRFGYNEHFVVGFCFVYPPLIFWTLLNVAEKGQWRHSLLLALLVAAMTLTYVRTSAVFLPAMAVFALWIFLTQKNRRKNLIQGSLLAGLIFIPLGVLPLLPFLRESQWMTLFQYDPFSQWQANFAMKTGLSWLDHNSDLMTGAPPWFTVDKGGFYVGVAALLLLAVFFLWKQKREQWKKSFPGKQLCFFLALGLFLSWLSFGPRSVLQGHFEFLNVAQNVLNWIIPLTWLLLFAQGFIIIQLWPEKIKHRTLWITISLLIYFLIPGFSLIEKLPLYNQIRAPWVFWEVGGSFCLAVAVGLLAPMVLKEIFPKLWLQIVVSGMLLALLLVDFFPYHLHFTKGELSKGTFENFQQVQQFLREQKNPGKVFFISGRYFYLLTPHDSNRGLLLEAFHSHFMPKWSRQLTQAGGQSPDLLQAQLNLMGVSYVVLDKQDPDTPLQIQKLYQKLFPVVFENSFFAVLANSKSLAPAFVGKEFIAASLTNHHAKKTQALMAQMLAFAQFNYISVEQPTVDMSQPDLVGVGSGKQGLKLQPGWRNKTGTAFQKYEGGIQRENYHRFTVPNPAPGWLIVPESFHPDWVIDVDGEKQPVSKAFGALLAAKIPTGARKATFQFSPPGWYSGVLSFSLVSWLVGLALCATFWFFDRLKPAQKNS